VPESFKNSKNHGLTVPWIDGGLWSSCVKSIILPIFLCFSTRKRAKNAFASALVGLRSAPAFASLAPPLGAAFSGASRHLSAAASLRRSLRFGGHLSSASSASAPAFFALFLVEKHKKIGKIMLFTHEDHKAPSIHRHHMVLRPLQSSKHTAYGPYEPIPSGRSSIPGLRRILCPLQHRSTHRHGCPQCAGCFPHH
jgi:hypothetical protein